MRQAAYCPLISPPVQDQRTRARDFEFSRASVFHSFARSCWFPPVSVCARSSRERGRESRRECSLINKEQRRDEKRNRRIVVGAYARVRSAPLDGKRERNARGAHTFINFACLAAPLAAISLTTCRRGGGREKEKERVPRRQRAGYAGSCILGTRIP